VEPGFARLYKAGLGRDSGRRLERGSGTPFTPRTYAYLALALAALVTAPEQLLLSEVVARTRAAAAEAGIDLGEPNRMTERRALVAALKQLMTWQVLTEDEGSVDSYTGDSEADALLTIDREIARRLVGGPVSQAATPEDLIERAASAGEAGPRHRVRRLLVETPVVYLDDLTEEEVDWLRRSQRREQRILEDFAGLHAEIRAEGVALVDPEQELTDTQFPGTGTVAWAALLLMTLTRSVTNWPGWRRPTRRLQRSSRATAVTCTGCSATASDRCGPPWKSCRGKEEKQEMQNGRWRLSRNKSPLRKRSSRPLRNLI
jgi:uncharacterized protein (TIGR02678 family)